MGDGNRFAFSAVLIDDILGQAGTSTVADFLNTTYDSGTRYGLSGSQNDLVTNQGPGGDGLYGTNIIGGNPDLAGLYDYGGPTPTIYLQPGSPAIGAGVVAEFPGTMTAITTDQRGVSRISPPDLGAYEQVPIVSGVSPGFGPEAGGTTVTIIGTGFSDSSVVDFGGVAATGVVVDSSTSITATSPGGAGIVDVTVTTVTGTSNTSSLDQFAYLGLTKSYTVNNSGDGNGGGAEVTLREAFDEAVAGNEIATIEFAPSLAGQTITLSMSDTSWMSMYGVTGLVDNGAMITINGAAHRA